MHLPHPSTRPRRRLSQRSAQRSAPSVGFGALIEREAVLLRALNAAGSGRDIEQQRGAVVAIIAALRSRLHSLPAAERFEYLARVVQHAETCTTPIAPPRRETLKQHNADLARQLATVRAPTEQREAWDETLARASAAHREMASDIRWSRSSSRAPARDTDRSEQPTRGPAAKVPAAAPTAPPQSAVNGALETFVASAEQNDSAAMTSALGVVQSATEQQVQQAMVFVQQRRQISRGHLLSTLTG